MGSKQLAAAMHQALEEYAADLSALDIGGGSSGSPKNDGKRVSAFDMMARQPWAMLPDALETIASIARRENESPEAVAAKLGRPLQNTRSVTVRDGVAIVPVTGPVFRYANLFTDISGATSLDVLAREFSSAVNDPAVKAVVLEMDTPGGQASGIAEFAQQVRAAGKPVIAYVDGMAASAGYWIAAAADEIVTSKTGEVGSIGAVVGIDTRQQDGVLEIVSSQSPKKRPDASTDEGRQQIQARIDALAQVFVDDVAAYRGVTSEKVLSEFGQGDMRMGEEAVRLGMADRVSTLEEVIAGLAGTTQKGGSHTMATENTATPAAATPAITREYLAEHHSNIVQAIEHDAATAATASERARIQAIQATPLANVYGELMATAIADGKTPEQFAVAILAEEGNARTNALEAIKKDAPKPVVELADGEGSAVVKGNPQTEEKAQAKWDADESVRAEFGAFSTYWSFCQMQNKNINRK